MSFGEHYQYLFQMDLLYNAFQIVYDNSLFPWEIKDWRLLQNEQMLNTCNIEKTEIPE